VWLLLHRLAASADVVGVTIGSIVGHAACTAAAVVGGRHLAAHIDEHTVQVSCCLPAGVLTAAGGGAVGCSLG
jgi:putative Ca2+/H+ antiporter (TMEM165/GDT1 family)